MVGGWMEGAVGGQRSCVNGVNWGPVKESKRLQPTVQWSPAEAEHRPESHLSGKQQRDAAVKLQAISSYL